MTYIVVYKKDEETPQVFIGPFGCFGDAYEALCKILAPLPGGHKYVGEVHSEENT